MKYFIPLEIATHNEKRMKVIIDPSYITSMVDIPATVGTLPTNQAHTLISFSKDFNMPNHPDILHIPGIHEPSQMSFAFFGTSAALIKEFVELKEMKIIETKSSQTTHIYHDNDLKDAA